MSGLNENLAKRVAPSDEDKGMAARTRASIEKTFTTMAEVSDGPLGALQDHLTSRNPRTP